MCFQFECGGFQCHFMRGIWCQTKIKTSRCQTKVCTILHASSSRCGHKWQSARVFINLCHESNRSVHMFTYTSCISIAATNILLQYAERHPKCSWTWKIIIFRWQPKLFFIFTCDNCQQNTNYAIDFFCVILCWFILKWSKYFTWHRI